MYKSGISFNRKMEGRISLFGVEDDPVVLGLEPLHGVVLDQLLRGADASRLPPAVAHVGAGSAQHDVEVHAVDAIWVFLNQKISSSLLEINLILAFHSIYETF